ncbi:MAG TPA: response regulator transcription factor, partial [Edaphobacter sp.]|nr:response regulator transcription factor [Edaphobacter sp.]
VHEGRAGLERASSGEYSLVILDVMLPRMNGLDLLKELRAHSSVPVLMLTARGDDIDRIVGLEVGADDYLPKPFHPRELIARIKAILRRLDERQANSGRFTVGDITVDVSSQEAWLNSNPLRLTTIELALLEALVRDAGRPLSREYLTSTALGRKLGAFDRTIDVHISNLRKKLNEHHSGERIKTVRGSGYLLAPHPHREP